jgi:hypothetical protein
MEYKKIIPLIFVLGLATVGCSKKSSSGETATTPTDTTETPAGGLTPPGGSGGSGSSSTATNEAVFSPVSFSEMNSYVAIRPLNAPSDYKVVVDLQADAEGRYYGSVRIKYKDNGNQYEGVFNSGSGINSKLPYSNSNYLKEYVYNVWFDLNNQRVFSGFFQDQYGSVVLVIDGSSAVNQGDGQGGERLLSGQIWYKNFPYTQAVQGPERKCWYITLGPYQCGSSPVFYKNALTPSDTYRKLGTFTGLSKNKAFKAYQQ